MNGPVETALRGARDAGRALLVPYVTGGISDDWIDYVLAYQESGADAVEIGLPFSIPCWTARRSSRRPTTPWRAAPRRRRYSPRWARPATGCGCRSS
ncbi:hypothetical protein ACFQX7_33525 [Luedemannella flava]